MSAPPMAPPPAADCDWAELHCLSNFSFLRGASRPDELVIRAAALGYRALALTDECSLAGVVLAHDTLRRRQLPLRLIIGSEIPLVDGPTLVLLARDRQGYGGLCRLITQGRRRAAKGHHHLTRADLAGGLPGCTALLSLPHGATAAPGQQQALLADAHWLAACFGPHAALALSLSLDGDDAARLARAETLAHASGLPLVAAGGVLMHSAGRRPLADVLTATRLRIPLADAGLALAANAERRLHTRAELARRYPPALREAALRIADACRFSLDELRYEYPDELVPPAHTPTSWLRCLVEGGLRWRHCHPKERPAVAEPGAASAPAEGDDPAPTRVRQRIEYELTLIAELGYEHYFLTVHDIVRFARQAGILCQGRGSAANSAVCWALGITEVKPDAEGLLIERFISRERDEPPDIDVDFEHERREEVIQYLYAKYGRHRAALAATVIRYQPRSALRDVGRALGLPAEQIARLCRDHRWFDGHQIQPERLREAGFDPDSRIVRQWVALTGQLIGHPRHLSQHVGGFVLARGRLDELVPVENASMPGRTVIQWDKDDLDAAGLMKVDVLGLGMLSALRRALDHLSAWHGWRFTLADIPQEIGAVYDMLSRADTVGVFQVESRAQMTMLPRLRPRTFYDLVVEVAIVRPGPIQGGMVHPYLAAREARRRGRDPVARLREEIRPVLRRTCGVPIFQEQVMELAMVAAGFSAGEADQLRRAMGAWRRQGELERYRAQLIDGLRRNGYPAEFARRLCDQIEGFGSYGFPESHAASFALLVYFSAWIKCFHPAIFLCALLDSQPMGFYTPSQLIQDARRHGVPVRPPDVLASDWHCTLETDPDDPGPGGAPQQPRPPPAVRLGLDRIRGLPRASAERLIAARAQAPFSDTDDLARRARLNARDMRLLAGANALAGLAGHRRHALWQAAATDWRDDLLLAAPTQRADETRPDLAPPREGEALVADYARLGFTLGRHPLALLRPRLDRWHFLRATDLARCHDQQWVRVAGLVTCRQRPGTAKGTLFVTLEDETGMINLIVRPELLARQRRALLGPRLLGARGRVSRQGEVVHVIVERVVGLRMELDLPDDARNFH